MIDQFPPLEAFYLKGTKVSELKKCTKCEIEQPLENFLPATRVKSGLQARCKNCSNEWHKKNYINNKNNMLIIRKNYYLDNDVVEEFKEKLSNYSEYNQSNTSVSF